MEPAPSYRSDVDGLRAIAVFLVLLFHFEVPGFDGGLGGVDVFFVISGFLITEMIVRPNFTFVGFFARRVARLLPALAFTVAATLLAGYFLMDAVTFLQTSSAAIYSLLGTSNIYFGQTISYFDDVVFSQPLIHTWTLSLEWQFYAIWPFIIVAAGSVAGQRGQIAVILGIIAASLWAQLYFLPIAPEIVFYNLPFRAFELALGGLMFFAPQLPRLVREIGPPIGLAMITLGVMLKTPETPFPGIWVLLFVAGAAMVISGKGSATGRLLGNPALSYVGRLSYAIYLVHWPIITFARYVLHRPLTATEILIATLAIFLAAVALHHLIENPMRITSGKEPTGGLKIIAAIITIVATTNAASAVVSTAGMPSRINSDYENSWFGHMPCGIEGDRNSLNQIECNFGNPLTGRILVIGDSHSRQFAYGLSESPLADSYSFKSIFSGSCVPIIGEVPVVNGIPRADCLEAVSLVEQELLNDYDLVIISARWRAYTSIGADDIARLRQMTDDPVLIIGPTPFPVDVIPCNRPLLLVGSCESFPIGHRDLVVSTSFERFAEQVGAKYADPIASGCPDAICPFYINRVAVYSDANHLSMVGSAYYISQMSNQIEAVLGR